MAMKTIYDTRFLKNQIENIINFYHPSCIDKERGGYINQFNDVGEIVDRDTKHLVGTCRFIYNYAVASFLFENQEFKECCNHGIEYLLNNHRNSNGGYSWILDNNGVKDDTLHCYGHAFVLLAFSISNKINSNQNIHLVYELFDYIENTFWEPESNLYIDEIDPNDINHKSTYRGQNSNMHMCEAMLVAYEVTNDIKFFDRAYNLSNQICNKLSTDTGGYIWEHYDQKWNIDWSYNINNKKDLFRPYGFLSGHFFEWTKLLLKINKIAKIKWLEEKALFLYNSAIEICWDYNETGFHYSFDKETSIIDRDRYYWVIAEAIVASALLANLLGKQKYINWYEKLWGYSLKYFIDKKFGGWYRILNNKNITYDNYKSPPAKTDYHPLSACFEIINDLSK